MKRWHFFLRFGVESWPSMITVISNTKSCTVKIVTAAEKRQRHRIARRKDQKSLYAKARIKSTPPTCPLSTSPLFQHVFDVTADALVRLGSMVHVGHPKPSPSLTTNESNSQFRASPCPTSTNLLRCSGILCRPSCAWLNNGDTDLSAKS